MAITVALAVLPPPYLQNSNHTTPITTTPDTVTIQVDPNYPRIIQFVPTVDMTWRCVTPQTASVLANTALTLEVPVTSVFTVTGASAGTLNLTVLR